jgi:hypothetical protein
MNNSRTAMIARMLRGVIFVIGMALAMEVSASAAPRYYGYSYGPDISYDYITAPIYGGHFGEPFRMSRPLLSLEGFWRDGTKRRAIGIIKGRYILIR